MTEMKAFLGLLIVAGVSHSAHESLDELWCAKTGRPIFRATMTLKRFESFLRFMRFDNKNTRPQRREQDKLAAFRDVWTMFDAQLPKFYILSTDLTVDEQLVSFRGKCPFRQFMKSKPAKYGIQIWWNCDALSSYPLRGQVYLGKQPGQEREVNQGARVVKDLVNPWYGTGRNVNADNLFTSVALAEELLYFTISLMLAPLERISKIFRTLCKLVEAGKRIHLFLDSQINLPWFRMFPKKTKL